MALLNANWWRGPFVPLGPDEDTQEFGKRMLAREQQVPFRRWWPVWQVQISPPPPRLSDEPGAVLYLSAYSSLMRRNTAVAEAERQAAELGPPPYRVRAVDVGTGEVAFEQGPAPGQVFCA